MGKKILSMLLALALCLGMLPAQALAVEGEVPEVTLPIEGVPPEETLPVENPPSAEDALPIEDMVPPVEPPMTEVPLETAAPTEPVLMEGIVASGECGQNGANVTWSLDETGTLTISGKGYMASYNTYSDAVRPPWYSNRELIQAVIIENGVNSVGMFAFYNCSNLTSVTFPDNYFQIRQSAFEGTGFTSLTIPGNVSVGGDAFKYCKSLTSVTILAGDPTSYLCMTTVGEWFSGCSNLETVELPDTITSIGNFAFRDCSKLANITIPDGVTSIEKYAFSGCRNLTSVTIPQGVTSMGDYAFENSGLTSLTIQDGVTVIGYRAFRQCIGLTSVTIPSSVTTFGNEAFDYCVNLTEVTLQDGLATLGNSAFYRCSKLTSVTIPGSLTVIPSGAFSSCTKLEHVMIQEGVTTIDEAFWGCSSLTSVTIPDSVTTLCIGSGCSSLTSVTIPDSVTTIGRNAFSGSGLTSVTIPDSVTTIGSGAFSRCTGLTSVAIPEGVTSIDGLFQGCSNLASVMIPDSVTTIGNEAFSGCEKLMNVTIPAGVTIIGGSAFSYCTGLESVMIPPNVTSLGSYAFSQSGLTSVTIPEGVTTIGSNAFSNCKSLTEIMIPASVTTLGSSVFSSSSNLKHIHYGGSQARWEELSTGKYLGIPDKAEITFGISGGENGEPLKYAVAGGNLIFDKDTQTVTGYDGSIIEAPIPLRIDGADVKAIADEAFKGCGSLTKVTVTGNVESIGVRAFQGCTGLESVAIPNSVTSIGAGAFDGCTMLTTIYYGGTQKQWDTVQENGAIPGGVKVICNSSGNVIAYSGEHGRVDVYGGNIYFDLDTRTVIDCDESVTAVILRTINGVFVEAIGDEAFKDCVNLKSVTLMEKTKAIGEYAFSGCEKLESIAIPSGVTEIKDSTFSGCTALTVVTLPDSVTSIGESAFANCTALTNFLVPGGIKTIEAEAFSGCAKLWRIGIPETVTRIAQNAFLNTNLSNVEYGGTKDQWKKVTIAPVGNEKLTSSLINTWKYFTFSNNEEHFFNDGEEHAHKYFGSYEKYLKDIFPVVRWNKFSTWGGACFGMAALEGMVNTEVYPVNKIGKDNKTDITKVDFPCDNANVRSLVEYYWAVQLLPNPSDKDKQCEVGTVAGREALRNLVKKVLGINLSTGEKVADGSPCMINYFKAKTTEDGEVIIDLVTGKPDTGSGHAFVIEGGRVNGDYYDLIGRDNRFYGLNAENGLPLASCVRISKDFQTCTVIPPAVAEHAVRQTDGKIFENRIQLNDEIVAHLSVYDDFTIFSGLDPTIGTASSSVSAQLFDESEPQTALFYCLPETTSVDSLVLSRNDLARDADTNDGVVYRKYINRGSTLGEAAGDMPAGLMMELDTAITGEVYTLSGFDGTCTYIGPEGMAVVSVEDTNASAEINMENHAVKLENNTGEFSVTIATSERNDTIVTVTGNMEGQGKTVTVTATDDGGVTLNAPEGAEYEVTFGDEDSGETVTVTGGGNVKVENPTVPIPCDSTAYTAEIEWKGDSAYTVKLTEKNGTTPTLTGWQACYDNEGKLLSVTGLTKTGMSFSGKVSQEGTCYLFILDGNSRPVIQKYNLTNYCK